MILPRGIIQYWISWIRCKLFNYQENKSSKILFKDVVKFWKSSRDNYLSRELMTTICSNCGTKWYVLPKHMLNRKSEICNKCNNSLPNNNFKLEKVKIESAFSEYK